MKQGGVINEMDLFTPEAHTISKTFISGQTPVLRVSLSSPSLSGELAAPFNRYNEALAKMQFHRAETTLFPLAEKDLQSALWEERPFVCHTLRSDFRIYLLTSTHISLYTETYSYSGGAHGHIAASAQTWDLRQGVLLTLSDLFRPGYAWEGKILSAISAEARKRARQKASEYYSDLPKRIRTYFDPHRFYVTNSALYIFYPLYSLAPYETGIPIFSIPFRRFGKNFVLFGTD